MKINKDEKLKQLKNVRKVTNVVLLISSVVLLVLNAVSVFALPGNGGNGHSTNHPPPEPHTQAIISGSHSSPSSGSNNVDGGRNLACIPTMWEQGSPSCYDPDIKRNIPATVGGLCPNINPAFRECVAHHRLHVQNRGRDFVTSLAYWGSWKEKDLYGMSYKDFKKIIAERREQRQK